MSKASTLTLFDHESHTLSSNWVLRKPLIKEGGHNLTRRVYVPSRPKGVTVKYKKNNNVDFCIG
jgi:hypothetical protein